jgi:threonine dehydratase
VVRRTPVFSAGSLSQLVGGTIALKAESLQRTGSFKLRGACAKVDAIDRKATPGVVAASVGNHALAVAYAARAAGLPCEVFVPTGAPLSKIAAVRAFGAIVHQRGDSVEHCAELARERASPAGMAFAHPFDDPDVIRGHATLGLELLEDVPDLAAVVLPVGGGGLASGVAMAVKRARPDVRIVGVQSAACAPLAGGAAANGSTIADGIAIKRPGTITRPLIKRWLDDVVAVPEESIADAMLLLTERAKLVVEGAGAVAVAALMTGAVRPPAHGTTIALLSGGNIDAGLLATLMQWAETGSGRRLRLFTRVPDRPGGLAGLLQAVADAGANVLEVDHVRDGVARHVRETGIELTLETRDGEHGDELCAALRQRGYEIVLG